MRYAKQILSYIFGGALVPILILLLWKGISQSLDSEDSRTAIDVVANCATAVAVLVAVMQLHASNRQHKENARRVSAEKAIEIAKQFSESLVNDITFITCVLRLIGHDKYEKTLKQRNDKLCFSEEEMLEIFGENAANEFKVMQNNITLETLSKAAIISSQRVVNRDNSAPDSAAIINKHAAFNRKRNNVLNTLEWIAMMINTGVADEKVIYQSLHQIILSYIRLEYPTIALFNHENCASDQYYTNLILLYNTWQKRNFKQMKIDKRNATAIQRRLDKATAKKQKRREKNVAYAPRI